MEPFPITRYLVPAIAPGPPPDATLVQEPMSAGVPHAISVARDTQLIVLFPTGLGVYWRDIDPTTPVIRAVDETTPHQPGAIDPVVDRTQLYVQLRQAGRTLGCAPIHVGARALLPDNGGGGVGVQYEVWFKDYSLYAGTIRGAGEYGSSVSLAWRRADAAVSNFGTPPPNVHLIRRLLPRLIESWTWSRIILERPLTLHESVTLRRMPIDAVTRL